MPDPRLISVRAELVMETMVSSMSAAVDERMRAPLPGAVERALGTALTARAGYLAREVELERFEPARARLPWLAKLMRHALAGGRDWSAAAAEVAGELERREPGDRPDPADQHAATWKVPGPGGHVRHYMALVAAERLGAGTSAEEAKRTWLLGFFVHCCAEAVPPSPVTVRSRRRSG